MCNIEIFKYAQCICRNIQKDTSPRLGHKKRARTSPFFWSRIYSNIHHHKRWKLFLLHSLPHLSPSYNLKVLAYRHHFRREVERYIKNQRIGKPLRLRKQFQTTNTQKHTFLNIETIWIPGKQITSKKNWISPNQLLAHVSDHAFGLEISKIDIFWSFLLGWTCIVFEETTWFKKNDFGKYAYNFWESFVWGKYLNIKCHCKKITWA